MTQNEIEICYSKRIKFGRKKKQKQATQTSKSKAVEQWS